MFRVEPQRVPLQAELGTEEETEVGLGPPSMRKGADQLSMGGGGGRARSQLPGPHLAELRQQPQWRQLPVSLQQVVGHIQVPQVPQLFQAWGRDERGGVSTAVGEQGWRGVGWGRVEWRGRAGGRHGRKASLGTPYLAEGRRRLW